MMPSRHTIHFQDKEPLLERYLRFLRYQKVKKLIPLDCSLLDIGCGCDQYLLCKLSSIIKSGTGVDLVDAPAKAKKIKMVQANANNRLPFPDQTFDVVSALANLEHLENPAKALTEMHRVLKNGGTLVLSTPSTKAKPVLEFLAFRLHLISTTEIADHKSYFSPQALTKLLQKCGFATESISVSTFELGMNLFARATK